MSSPDSWDLEQQAWKLLQSVQDGKLGGCNKEGNAFWNLEVVIYIFQFQFNNNSTEERQYNRASNCKNQIQ